MSNNSFFLLVSIFCYWFLTDAEENFIFSKHTVYSNLDSKIDFNASERVPKFQVGKLRGIMLCISTVWLSMLQICLALQETEAPCRPVWGRQMNYCILWEHFLSNCSLYEKCVVAETFHKYRPKCKVQKPQRSVVPKAQFFTHPRVRGNKLCVNYCQMIFHAQLIGDQTPHQKSYRMASSNFCWFYFQFTLVSIVPCSASSLYTGVGSGHAVHCTCSCLAKPLSSRCSYEVFLHEF